jgi:ribosomal protein S18 acetylase RimI-like enzyme
MPGTPVPTLAFVQRCLDTLQAQGFRGVVTGALAPQEQRAFLAAGFSEAERLHLLSHNLRRLPAVRAPEPPVRIRRTHTSERAAVLALDDAAFPPFWRLDDRGLTDAIEATPRTRFAVACDAGTGRLEGYAVTGRSGRNGYLQRLAVDPSAQGRRIGASLVVDGLRWLARWRAEQCVVNTQWGNANALELYERLGFRRLPHGLAVLAAGDVDRTTTSRPAAGRRP